MYELTKPCTKFYSRQREQNVSLDFLEVDGEDTIKVYLI